ncbi:MAG TPA: GGDEF domain-containing protein, partial [Geobacteraceae bacterium]|nr:GGDEF domain-containing protein [Geobacteraceae bacterium]
YAIFGIIDCLILPQIRGEVWFIRYCLVCPLAIGVYSLTFTGYFRKMMQTLLVFTGLAGSAGLVTMIVITPYPWENLYFAGLLLCLMFFFTFPGLRFIAASILSCGTFLLYVVMVIWQTDISIPVLTHNIFVLVAFNITGMWSSYSRERSMRSDFLHRRTILEQSEELRIALLDVEQARQEAEDISRLDPLTNLYNRRHFLSLAELEFERNRRYHRCLAVIMMDIDHFKVINDTHGHCAGDLVLLSVANNIRNTLRGSDIPCRYGGEEFAILLPETNLPAAVGIGVRLREVIESTIVEAGINLVRVTVSVGIAGMFEGEQGKIEVWINRADQALYEAKQTGRNRVKVWEPGDTTAAAPC